MSLQQPFQAPAAPEAPPAQQPASPTTISTTPTTIPNALPENRRAAVRRGPQAPDRDPARALRNRRAHGCRQGAAPRRPGSITASTWRPGDPAHWQEQSGLMRVRGHLVRVFAFVHLALSAAYLQHRARHTLGVFPESRHFAWFALQIAFFCYELFVAIFALLQLPEHWNIVDRNAVRFDAIPARLVRPLDDEETESASDNGGNTVQAFDPSARHYPTVDFIIPCYKEDVRLVRPTVRSALDVQYPSSRLNVYLCDDGRDPLKQRMVRGLRATYPNVHYITRANNNHAKPGNVNNALERTNGRLIAQLDADFIARPDLLQRLLTYYYVWNEQTGRYEFNDTLGVVQTPQHYRNLSPSDPDVFDQRIIFYNNLTLIGKDWFNTSTMVGTGNLLNRTALNATGNFPYHSFGDDTALSAMFHGLGFRSYFVNKPVANGLVPSSLRGNLAQRARWYVTDSQILFSKHGALTQKGLNLVQRVVYLNMWLQRLLAILNIFVDVVIVLVLVAGFSVVDVTDTPVFLAYLVPQLVVGSLFRFVLCIGVPGAIKSTAGYEVFETAFKYSTAKGVLLALLKSKSLRWKVAEKVITSTDEETSDDPDYDTDTTATAQRSGDGNGSAPERDVDTILATETAMATHEPSPPTTNGSAALAAAGTTAVDIEAGEPAAVTDEADLGGDSYGVFVLKNLKRCWYNVFMLFVLIAALCYAVARPPGNARSDLEVVQNGVRGRIEYSKRIPLALAFAFALANASAHALMLSTCFKRQYVTPFMVDDPVNGRCDQFVERDDGSVHVPMSYVSVVSMFRMVVLVAGVVFLVVFALRDDGSFVPL